MAEHVSLLTQVKVLCWTYISVRKTSSVSRGREIFKIASGFYLGFEL